jgi:hypothetical protein
MVASLLLIPIVTNAQSSSHPAIPVSTLSSSLLSSVDLPDAPLPLNPQAQAQQQKPPQNNEPSLGDLGFTPAQTQANAKLQARLNKRTHMLKIHQTLGLITLAPLAATVIVSSGATPKHSHTGANGTVTEPGSAGVDLHAALGSTTAVMYGLTAYYAIAAPKIAGVKPKGAIRLHRDLVWVHLPGMVLTPILGGMALNEENQGEKPHGIAAAHSYVAWTTVTAYAASALAVSWPIHLKFWEK